MEIWKDIKNYEGLYQISNLGNVRSLDRYVRSGIMNNQNNNSKVLKKGKILKPRVNYKGYCLISLSKDNKQKNKSIHRLVAETFILNPDNKPQVNHINGIKTDNKVENLEWCNNSENQIHANRTGLQKNRILITKQKFSKPIVQYDLKGNKIKKYDSLQEASQCLKIDKRYISACATGKTKSSGGYIWKYVK